MHIHLNKLSLIIQNYALFCTGAPHFLVWQLGEKDMHLKAFATNEILELEEALSPSSELEKGVLHPLTVIRLPTLRHHTTPVMLQKRHIPAQVQVSAVIAVAAHHDVHHHFRSEKAKFKNCLESETKHLRLGFHRAEKSTQSDCCPSSLMIH